MRTDHANTSASNRYVTLTKVRDERMKQSVPTLTECRVRGEQELKAVSPHVNGMQQ